MSSGGGSSPTSSPSVCSRSWSISEDSLKRYVSYASESCIQELLAASDSGGGGGGDDGWKVLAVSPGKFMAVANAVDAAKQWESDLVDARYIRELGDDLSIVHLKLGADASKRTAGLFRRRDVVVYERRQTMDDGTLVVAVASLPKEIAAGLLPPGPPCCVVTYVVQLDPAAGWLPRCFVSRLNSKLVIMIVAKLKKMALATMHSAAADDGEVMP
uniref:START domain-containing protein n=1 Tax=Oryza barthii TaxID=65489 RepID=A0A0D3HK29_9ORYZ